MKNKHTIHIICATIALFFCFSCNPDEHKENPVNPNPPIDKPDVPGSHSPVYGWVTCEGEGVRNVVVSDGYAVTRTDSKGFYELDSDKLNGYVFISTPSGYEVPQKGIQPQFYQYIKDATHPEEISFTLKKAEQENYDVLFLGDMHLAQRMGDLEQFHDFTDEVNAYIDAHTARKTYAITLGDMAWDIFWYRYNLSDYLDEMNDQFGESLPVYHTIGNHDHESGKVGDFETVVTYRSILGPSYYSFNIGDVHYIVLDDILSQNTESERSFTNRISSDQLVWLKKDLELVKSTTPIVVTMHAPLYYSSGSLATRNSFSEYVALFSGFSSVYAFSGHTHILYNVDRLSSSVHVYEANSGAVCGAWWMTGSNAGIHLSGDGAPGGYRVMTVNGKSLRWYFKGTGLDSDIQFRAYDRNQICLSTEKYTPNATEKGKQAFLETVGEYATANSDNYVLINVWDWDPSWKVTVTENGNPLTVTQLKGVKDPLYLVCYEAFEYEHHYDDTVYYPAYTTDHMFRVKASAPDTTLEIYVTDRFGRSYRETMVRPRKF